MGIYTHHREQVVGLNDVHVIGEGHAPILRGVNLEVEPGERVHIQGPSGSGKSTVLRTIAGIVAPSQGEVRIFGQDTSAMSDAERLRLVRQRVGVGFQTANLDEGRTVVDNIKSLHETTRHHPPSQQLLAELVVAFGLEELLHQPAGELAGGEKQRVALARLLLPRPELILLDEPTASLDSTLGGKERAYNAIGWFAQQVGATVIVVSHDREAIDFATRTVNVRDGVMPAPAAGNAPVAA